MPLLNRHDYWYLDIHGPEIVAERREGALIARLKEWDDEQDTFYLIEFRNADIFKEVDLTNYIPADILSKIQDINSDHYLILENFHEGYNKLIPDLYTYVLEKYNIPPKKFVYYTGALDIQFMLDDYVAEHGKTPFNLELMLEFEYTTWERYHLFTEHLKHEPMPNTLQHKNYDKKFLNFNRRWRPHRPLLVALLKATDLLDKGYVSLGKADDDCNWQNQINYIIETTRYHNKVFTMLWNKRYDILNLPDLYLDTQDLVTNRASIELNSSIRNLYENTYFSVISETNYFKNIEHANETSCFLSEKVFKALLFKHPFILASTPNTLKYVRALGYKTFSPLINEDYDSIENDHERMLAILKEIHRLSKLEGKALITFLDFCKEVVEYNFNLLINKDKFTYRIT